MGNWGTGLYQNDIGEDVKSYFSDQLRRGKSTGEITQSLIQKYNIELQDQDDSFDFWCALADTQWNLGRLLPYVKANALNCLNGVNHLDRWKSASSAELKKRQQTIDKLRIKLDTPQPTEKKIAQYRFYRCSWEIGDTFALPLEGEYAKSKGFEGQFLLIQKVSERMWHPGHIIPITYLKITQNKMLPQNLEEYNQLEYVQTRSLSFSWGKWDVCQHMLASENVSNIILKTDEYGYLPMYRCSIIIKSKKAISSDLIYLGNYLHATAPKNEFIPVDEMDIPSVVWNDLCSSSIELFIDYSKR